MGLSETYFLRVGPQGRLFTWLEADDAGGSEETGFVKLAHTSKLLNRGMGVIHQLMPDGSSSTGRHLPPARLPCGSGQTTQADEDWPCCWSPWL